MVGDFELQTEATAFQVEQSFLEWKATAETHEVAVLSDDAVAWDDNRCGVRADSLPDGTKSTPLANALSDIAIGDSLSVRNFQQGIPHATLEWRASNV